MQELLSTESGKMPDLTQVLPNNPLHTDDAPVPRCARHGAPRVSR